MHIKALATDYDGTLASDGCVDGRAIAALERLVASGRAAILVTGRELADVRRIFPRVDLFARIVTENGGVLYRPASGEVVPLAPPPPDALVARLRARGVTPLAVGRVVIATREDNAAAVRDAIAELGLTWRLILNKGSIMVLPADIDKASGLTAALEELAILPADVVAIGDAENDRALLAHCGCGVAVANALPLLKDDADWVTDGASGAGVVELIERLIGTDLAGLPRRWRGPGASAF